MHDRYSLDTAAAIKRTITYGPVINTRCPVVKRDGEIFLVDRDTVSCIFHENMVDKVAVLNYASYVNPGGNYLAGTMTQEEALCHESNLYSILSSEQLEKYYYWNRGHMNRGLYEDRALYTPDVVFEHRGNKRKVDVITCAAPNWSVASGLFKVTPEENEKVLRGRIKFMIKVARLNGARTLIAGAWGCGVFEQDPKVVAEQIVISAVSSRAFDKVYLAIPNDSGSRNFKEFEKVVIGG